jgi:hypothetical protein
MLSDTPDQIDLHTSLKPYQIDFSLILKSCLLGFRYQKNTRKFEIIYKNKHQHKQYSLPFSSSKEVTAPRNKTRLCDLKKKQQQHCRHSWSAIIIIMARSCNISDIATTFFVGNLAGIFPTNGACILFCRFNYWINVEFTEDKFARKSMAKQNMLFRTKND